MQIKTITWSFKQDIVEPLAWIDLRLFDDYWREANDYVGPQGVGSNQPGKYEKVGDYLRSMQILHYPFVSLDFRDNPFNDGRHRTAWLRDHGAQAMPFSCSSQATADKLVEMFGTNQRKTAFNL